MVSLLGGGGVRGFSHIGVLNVLEQEGIDIDVIVGTSAGALIGGAYASGQSPREIQAKIDAYLRSPEFDASTLKSIGMTFSQEHKSFFKKAQNFVMNRFWFAQAFFKPSMLPSDDFQSLISYFLPEIDIRETQIPFRVVSTDLITGRQVVFSEGHFVRRCWRAAPFRERLNRSVRETGFLLTAASRVSFPFTRHARPGLTLLLP